MASNRFMGMDTAAPRPSQADRREQKKHETMMREERARDGLRTLQRAQEIGEDHQLMRDIHRVANADIAKIGKVLAPRHDARGRKK